MKTVSEEVWLDDENGIVSGDETSIYTGRTTSAVLL